MSSGKLSFDHTKFVSKEESDELNKRCNPEIGDILLSKVGTTGVPALVNTTQQFSLFVSLALIKFFPHLVNTDFFVYEIKSPLVQEQAKEHTRGVGNKNWVLSDISDTLFALPPFAEQKRIVKKLEQILPLVEEYDKAQTQLDNLNKQLPEALKKSILQEAIQGKLVPQNPKDEPASALLAKILQEKERLVKEGKLKKKDLEVKPIEDDETPFEIPEGWAWCRMGEIGSWGSGATPPKGNPEFYSNGVIPWLVTGELNNSVVTETRVKVSQKALEKCSLRLCKPGDILIAMYGATIGKLAIAGIDLTTNQACCACTLHYDFNKYLFYFLMACKGDLVKRGEGGAQPNISKEKLVGYLIPIPPLAEQKRIVAKIEELFDKINA